MDEFGEALATRGSLEQWAVAFAESGELQPLRTFGALGSYAVLMACVGQRECICCGHHYHRLNKRSKKCERVKEVAHATLVETTWRPIVVAFNIYSVWLYISTSGVRMLGVPVCRVLESVDRACQCKLERYHEKQQANYKPAHKCLVYRLPRRFRRPQQP